ncbi:retrovirus-related pol polyprotein from transposon TNT 1-94 [Tanacetum coccineum]
MTENRRLFTSYKAYDGEHVVFKSNLKVKVVGRGNITHDSITITNVEHVSGLAIKLISVGHQGNANNRTRKEVSTNRILELLHLDLVGPYPIQSYGGNFYTLIIVDDYSKYTWIVFVNCKDDVLEKFKILCKKLENLHDCSVVSIITNHNSKFDKLQFRSFCEQHGMSYNLSGPFTSEPDEIVERTHRKLRKMSRVMLAEILSTSKVYIMLNKETMRIEESLNVTLDESLPEPKSSSSTKDDRIDEPIVQDLNGSSSLQINVLDEGYRLTIPRQRREKNNDIGGIDEEASYPWEQHSSCDINICRAFLKLCIVEDPIWEKISHELEEPIRSAHVDECVCCQVQHMTEESLYALRKEMREIHTNINNDLKVLTAVVEDIAIVFLQDINE